MECSHLYKLKLLANTEKLMKTIHGDSRYVTTLNRDKYTIQVCAPTYHGQQENWISKKNILLVHEELA